MPGDKSIAHRWLILAATARGRSRLVGLPASLDVRSTASCLALVSERGRPALEAWARNVPPPTEGHGSTWNDPVSDVASTALEVEGEGRSALTEPGAPLDCGNSGTTMRLVAGTLAAAPFRSVLVGDASLSARPMERVAAPLREMGATVTTADGHAPLEIVGGPLYGISYAVPIPTAQVKGAVLFAGVAAEGETTVTEPAATRDHTERAFAALGAPVSVEGTTITLQGVYQHDAFAATVPGDVSSAAFLVAAAALTGSELTVRGVGLNPSRSAFPAGPGADGRAGRDPSDGGGARGAGRRPVGGAGRRASRHRGDGVGAPPGDRRGAGPGPDGDARPRRDVVRGRRRAPGEGERPAHRRGGWRARPRRARRRGGRRPGRAGARAARGSRTVGETTGWRWRSRSRRSPRTLRARSRAWRLRTYRSPGSSRRSARSAPDWSANDRAPVIAIDGSAAPARARSRGASPRRSAFRT